MSSKSFEEAKSQEISHAEALGTIYSMYFGAMNTLMIDIGSRVGLWKAAADFTEKGAWERFLFCSGFLNVFGRFCLLSPNSMYWYCGTMTTLMIDIGSRVGLWKTAAEFTENGANTMFCGF